MLINRTQVLEAYLVKGLSNEELKKFITRERWLASLGLGFFGLMLYFIYKNWNFLHYWDLFTAEQKAKAICSSLENRSIFINLKKKLQDSDTSKVEDEKGTC